MRLCLVHLGRHRVAAAQLDIAVQRLADNQAVELDRLVEAYLRARLAAEMGDLDGAREHASAARSLIGATEAGGVGSVAEAVRWLGDFDQPQL